MSDTPLIPQRPSSLSTSSTPSSTSPVGNRNKKRKRHVIRPIKVPFKVERDAIAEAKEEGNDENSELTRKTQQEQQQHNLQSEKRDKLDIMLELLVATRAPIKKTHLIY